MSNYGEGDTVIYHAFGGERRTVKVEIHEADIKNGLPGFAGREVSSGMTVWGYDDQVVQVVR